MYYTAAWKFKYKNYGNTWQSSQFVVVFGSHHGTLSTELWKLWIVNWSEHHCAVLDVLASSRAASQAAMTWLSGEYRSRCCLTSNWPFEWQPGLKLSEPWFPPLIPPSPPPPTSCSYNLLSSCLHIFITTLVLRIPMKVFLGLCFAQEPLCLPLFPDSVTTSSPWTCTTVVDAAWLTQELGCGTTSSFALYPSTTTSSNSTLYTTAST